jgi:hypothetical protein
VQSQPLAGCVTATGALPGSLGLSFPFCVSGTDRQHVTALNRCAEALSGWFGEGVLRVKSIIMTITLHAQSAAGSSCTVPTTQTVSRWPLSSCLSCLPPTHLLSSCSLSPATMAPGVHSDDQDHPTPAPPRAAHSSHLARTILCTSGICEPGTIQVLLLFLLFVVLGFELMA